MATKSSSSKAKNRVKSTQSFPLAVKALKNELAAERRYLKFDKQEASRLKKIKDKDQFINFDLKFFGRQIIKGQKNVEELTKAIAKLS